MDDSSRTPPPWRLVAAFAAGQLITLSVTLGPLVATRWREGFRAYFSNDQLSYAAIAVNVSRGDYSFVEPLTQTGSLFYPSAWYQLIGTIALISGVPVHILWTVMGALIAGIAVLIVGWTAYRFSGRWFAPVLPALLLLTGTLSSLVAHYWYTPISAHAVLWGPYGSLFTLNAENAALSIGAIAVSLLLLSTRAAHPARFVVVAALLVGLLANVQTYTFFTALSLVAVWAAISGSFTAAHRRGTWLTVALLAVVLVGGSTIARITGPLPMFGLLLIALGPAAYPVWRARPHLISLAVLTTALAAAPQVVRTGLGLIGDDPFLTYREASTKDLGVPLATALLAALPLLLIGLACLSALTARRDRTLLALLLALPLGSTLMTTNDRWGFNQEPYRFWIQYLVLSALLLGILIAVATTRVRSLSEPRRRATAALAVVAAGVWAFSLIDLTGWWSFARDAGVISATDSRAQAARSLLEGRPGMFAAAPCVEPQWLKLIGADRVAHYNKGLAWPDGVENYEILQDPGRRNTADPVALRAAEVDFVIADTACADQWVFSPQDQVTVIETADYAEGEHSGTLTLLKVLPR